MRHLGAFREPSTNPDDPLYTGLIVSDHVLVLKCAIEGVPCHQNFADGLPLFRMMQHARLPCEANGSNNVKNIKDRASPYFTLILWTLGFRYRSDGNSKARSGVVGVWRFW